MKSNFNFKGWWENPTPEMFPSLGRIQPALAAAHPNWGYAFRCAIAHAEKQSPRTAGDLFELFCDRDVEGRQWNEAGKYLASGIIHEAYFYFLEGEGGGLDPVARGMMGRPGTPPFPVLIPDFRLAYYNQAFITRNNWASIAYYDALNIAKAIALAKIFPR